MARAAAKSMEYASIMSQIKAGTFHPVYYLMGKEPYFIDRISEALEQSVVQPEARDFDMAIFYAADLRDLSAVVNAARRYPMMSPRQLVVVKEAQGLRDLTMLLQYLRHPLECTVLVFCHKYGSLDARKKTDAAVLQAVSETGVLFESAPVGENQLPRFIETYLGDRGRRIEDKAVRMLSDMVGTDLSRLSGELDKLHLALGPGEGTVTPELVEKCVGISREFNVFELENALLERDVEKANRIARYLGRHEKENPLPQLLAVLFTFFSNLLLAYYAPDKSERGISGYAGMSNKSAWDCLRGMKVFSARKTMEIISFLRELDARSKGADGMAYESEDLLRELVFMILH